MTGKSIRAKQQLGQFFTPASLAGFAWEVVALLQSNGLSRRPLAARGVLEPAVGAGVFLREGLARGLAAERMVGLDIDPELAPHWERLTREHPGLRLVLANALLPHADLSAPFEVIIGNPPYGSDGLAAIAAPVTPAEHALARCVRDDFEIHRKPGAPLRPERLHTFPIECLFVERCLRLCADGGWVALLLPEGLLSNQRLQHVRDWVEARGAIRAVVSLPAGAFRSEGTAARTALVVIEKATAAHPAVLFEAKRASDLSIILAALEATLRGATGAKAPATAQALKGQRWDPGFWSPAAASPLAALEDRYPLVCLGEFLSFITYGPIVTRKHPTAPSGEVVLINQGEIGYAGLDLRRAQRIAEGSPHDAPRSRPLPGDLLFARSGAGSLGKGRMAVLDEAIRANVGCFVDILRFDGLDPHVAWLYLASRFGQGQIRRLINGVATPNLSFKAIKSLRVPVLGRDRQTELARLYLDGVRASHRALLAAAPGAEPERQAAVRAMQGAIGAFEAGLMGEG